MASRARGARVLTSSWLLPVTVLGTYAVILLGIYTAAVGAGLTCAARWPLCDGAVFGLFPANWPSFVEWFHRLVAMLTGFLILASWLAIARAGRSRALVAMSTAVLFLPVQIWLGAGTVWGYELGTLIAHFLVAFVILAGVIAAATWWNGLDPRRWPGLPAIFAVLLLMMIPFVALTPHFLVVHTGGVQMLYYGLGLFVIGTLVWVTVTSIDDSRLVLAIATAGAVLIVIQLLAGRVVRTSLVHTVDWFGAGLTVLVLALGVAVALGWIGQHERRTSPASG